MEDTDTDDEDAYSHLQAHEQDDVEEEEEQDIPSNFHNCESIPHHNLRDLPSIQHSIQYQDDQCSQLFPNQDHLAVLDSQNLPTRAEPRAGAGDSINSESYRSSKFYSFCRASHHLMVDCLTRGRNPSFEEIKNADSDIAGRYKNKSCVQDEKIAVEYRWREMQDRLLARIGEDGGEYLFHKGPRSARIPYREQWNDIFCAFHIDENNNHLGWQPTIKRIKEQWCTNTRRHGIPDSYIRDRVSACSGCFFPRSGLVKTNHDESSRSLKRRRRQEFNFSEKMTVRVSELSRTMEEIAVKYKVLLRTERVSTMNRPMVCEVKDYVCHRGKSRRNHGTGEDSKVRDRKSCRIGCPFRIRTIVPVIQLDGANAPQEGVASILLCPLHVGHQPGSEADLLRLPPHPSVIRHCEQDLSDNTGDTQAVARASSRRAPLLYSHAKEGEQASHRFFLVAKDVERLAYRLRAREALSEDDWTTLHHEAHALKSQGKVIFYQQYAPNHTDEDKRPFVLVLQNSWMRDVAKRFSISNAWVIDSIFKAIQFGLPLYAAIVTNQMGVELPVWFMLCSVDVGTAHECIALKLTLQEVFKWLGQVRPTAIIIDKSMVTLQAVKAVVDEDPFCWRDKGLGGEQVACHVLLCWFCVKKDWMENILPEVRPEHRKEIYQFMISMLLAETENRFETLLNDFSNKYKEYPNAIEYVNHNWGNTGSTWRRLWPKYCRLFEHGRHDTTISAEHLWQYIKHTLLRGRSNRNVRELVAALIGCSDKTAEQDGTLVDHYKQKLATCTISRNQGGRKRLIGGEYVLSVYESDPTVIKVVDEMSLKFEIKGELLPDQLYNVCLQNQTCDCFDTAIPCKHVLGLKMIVERYFPHLWAVMPTGGAALAVQDVPHNAENLFGDRSFNDAAEDILGFSLPTMESFEGSNNESLQALHTHCSELKVELCKLTSTAYKLTPAKATSVLHTVVSTKNKVQSFEVNSIPQEMGQLSKTSE